jgi:hypothetical protein
MSLPRYRKLTIHRHIPWRPTRNHDDPRSTVGVTTKETDMAKTFTPEIRKTRASIAVLVIGLLAGSAGQAWASAGFQTSPGQGAGRTFETSRGAGFVTGSIGSMQTTTLPGRPGQGLLMDNGNGTSTLVVPGGVPQVVATPR